MRLMRFRGYDVEYDHDASDEKLIRESHRRIVLTKDRPLVSRIRNSRVYLVAASGAEKQLAEIVLKFPPPEGVVRCLFCNAKLRRIAKRKVEHLVPPFVFRRHKKFLLCAVCRRIYWPGTHYERMSRMVE